MISIIIPFHNEKESLPELISGVEKSLANKSFEIILVDDGSTDGSGESLRQSEKIKIIKLPRQMGKGKALSEGFLASKGDVLIFMDADLEDSPDEIPKFIAKLEEGYDFVNGNRKDRHHKGIIKLYSGIVNKLIRKYLQSPFHDINCGFKIMKRSVLERLELYGNNFRFLPLAVYYEGFSVAEISVTHKSRPYGVSKFGTGKIFTGLIDTLTAYFIYRFAERPLHFFGGLSAALSMLGSIILLWLGYERIFYGVFIYRRPVLFLGMLLVIVGVQIGATGLIAELLVYLKHKKS